VIHYFKKKRSELNELKVITSGCWINITPPFDFEELEKLADKLEIPLEFLTDSLDIDERPRFEQDDNAKLIVVTTPVVNNVDDETAALYITVPIGIILTEDNIVTITSYQNPILQRFLDNKVKGFDTSDKAGFVLQIFEQNVLRFLSCLKDLNVRRNSLEQELYDSSRNRDLLKLLSIEKSLVYFVTALSTNALLKTKIQRTDILGIRENELKADMLQDIIIDINQAQEMANVYSNILSGTMDAFASIISNNLNVVIQRLTLVTIVLMVPTLVASFFGMNVKLPFDLGKTDSWWAFPAIFAFAACLSVSLVLVFKKNRML
jgi:magnesium transporter